MSPAPSFTAKRPGSTSVGVGTADASLRSAAAGRDGRPAQGRLACIAGFYDDESGLREAARLVRVKHGLASSQMVLLGPSVAAPLLFARVARRWASRPTGRAQGGLAVPVVLTALAASVLALPAVGWWVVRQLDLSTGAVVLGSVLSLLCIGVTAAALAPQWTGPVHDGGFDAIVRRELTEGRWALVLHRIAPDRQAGVARLVRNGSQRWCMDRPPPRAGRS